MKIIARKEARTRVGSFLLQNREYFKKNVVFAIEYKSSVEEANLRSAWKISGLPILVHRKKIIQGDEKIILYLLDYMQEKKSASVPVDDYDSWMQEQVHDFDSRVKGHKPLDDDDGGVPDYNKKIAEFNSAKEKIKPPLKGKKKTPDEAFTEAISDMQPMNTTISEDDLEQERFLDMLGKL